MHFSEMKSRNIGKGIVLGEKVLKSQHYIMFKFVFHQTLVSILRPINAVVRYEKSDYQQRYSLRKQGSQVSIIYQFSIFTDSSLWAGSVIESQCLYVCVRV